MFEKLFKLFKNKKDIINPHPKDVVYLNEVWAITSTYLDFEEYITKNQSKFFRRSFGIEHDMTEEIFKILASHIKLGYKVSSLKELNSNYQSLKESKIIKHIYTNCTDIKEQKELCELLLKIIHEQPEIYSFYYENFISYIEYINKILKKVGYYYSINCKQIISINNIFEEQNISSLFPLLIDYGQTEEFLNKAWKEYMDGDYDNCVINAGKATETVMKCICQRRSYSLTLDKDTFSKLFEVLNTNNFFSREEYIAPTLINNLIEGLKTGLPKHRNDSAHGSSLAAKNSNKYVAKLSLDLMIAYIHYFISLDKQI